MNRKLFSVNVTVAASAMAVAASTAIAPAQAAFMGVGACTGNSLTLNIIVSNNCSLEIGGQRLSNFTASLNPATVGGATPDALSDISLAGYSSAFGSGIDLSGGFSASGNQFIDLKLNYMVEAVDPGALINSVYLGFNGKASGTGYAEIVETVTNYFNGDVLAQISVNTSNPVNSLFASTPFTPLKKVLISKDLFLKGGGDGRATLSDMKNLTTTVPTPALLPGLVGMGIAAFRRQRKQTAELA
jgi:hypothetical protein